MTANQIFCCLLAVASLAHAQAVAADAESDRAEFERQDEAEWSEVFSDSCQSDNHDHWQDQWFLDGENAIVRNSGEAMTIDTSDGFAVLWTKQVFESDLKIEYDFRRVDRNPKGVNIIYIQATGDEEKGHAKDITEWSDRRTRAAMHSYYMNMHTYHISYAAFPTDYIRGRRYLPLGNTGLAGTALSGEVAPTGIFEDRSWIHVTIIKRHKELFIEFKNPNAEPLLCRLENEDKPGISEGRVGLRLMPERESEFRNFRISRPKRELVR